MLRSPASVRAVTAVLALFLAACAGDSTVSEGPLEPGGGEASNVEENEGAQAGEQDAGGGVPDEDENAVDG